MATDDYKTLAGLGDFLRMFHADEDRGEVRSLEEYQTCFPHLRDAIAQGFGALGETNSEGGLTMAPPARRIGPYELAERIGSGGQGEVHRAIDVRVGREVAIKFLAGLDPSIDPQRAERFRREATVASRLQHPVICPIYDVDTDAHPPYLVMPLLRGDTLAHRIASARESQTLLDTGASTSTPSSLAGLSSVLALFAKLARALHVAHEAGIVHRDVKPGNVFVTTEGEPVLLDFGLAHASDSDDDLTVSGQQLGTVPYMAPEQVSGTADGVDARTDVWGLGATLYEAVTLQRPFQGATRHAIGRAILELEPKDPRRIVPGLSRDLCVILQCALEKDRARRYPTALAFAEDLDRVRERRPIHARAATLRVRLVRWVQRDPALASASALAALLLVAGLGVALFLLGSRTEALREKTDLVTRLQEEQTWRSVALDELRLGRLEQEVDELWPATEALVRAPLGIDHWLATARALRDRLPTYRTMLEELRRGGRHATTTDDPRDRRRHERVLEELEDARHALEYNEAKATTWAPAIRSEIERRETDLTRPRLVFDDRDLARRHDSLERLVDGIPDLDAPIALIEQRRAFAQGVIERTVETHRDAWARAARAVADDPRFLGLTLHPVPGLVPLGPDPSSGLQEFAHLQTGSIPERIDGHLRIDAASGLVFILLPPGTFRMGCTAPSADAPEGSPNVDPYAQELERPAHEVRLDAFLCAKYPMTQGQWVRIVGTNPSQTRAGSSAGEREITLRHPVESITWFDAVAMLDRLEMRLPTEAQWEYAARGGTTWIWWTGDSPRSIDGAGNVADRYASEHGGPTTWKFESWMDDGHFVHSPVGIYAANDFGLHDVIGNVFEWCRDGFSAYDRPCRPGDGLRARSFMTTRVARGAGYSSPATSHRSGARARFSPEMKVYYLGVRPVISPLPSGD